MRTVGQWIEWAARQFEQAGLVFGHGTDNATDEAAWLVLHALGARPESRFKRLDELVDGGQEKKIEHLVRQRIERRCPAAYLTGTAWFAGLEFEVGPDVLVPRSPIAELVLDRFRPWFGCGEPRSILDLGTGSGCIAIACAKQFPGATVTATDISPAALGVARRNVARHDVGEQVELLESDLFDSLAGRRYDLIVSNPPYVPDSSMRALAAEFRAEPELGLRSGMNGLEIPLRILAGAPRHLEQGGMLVCEVGESEDALQRALPRAPFVWLEFSQGGSGVFLLEREGLETTAAAAVKLLEGT